MDARQGFFCCATIALTAFGCSSGPGDASSASGAGYNVTLLERAGSPQLPEDSAPEHPASCNSYVGGQAPHLSALLGRPLVGRRGASVDSHDTCSLLGDGVRVRFVTFLSSASEESTRAMCHSLAGATAGFVAGPGSVSWYGPGGAYTSQGGQCFWTQVYQAGSLDPVASLTVAQDVGRRWAVQP